MILTGSDSRSLGRILLGAIHADLYSTAKYCRERSLVQWERLFSFLFRCLTEGLLSRLPNGSRDGGCKNLRVPTPKIAFWFVLCVAILWLKTRAVVVCELQKKKIFARLSPCIRVYIVTVRVFKTSVTSWKLCDLTNSSELGERSKSLSWVVLRFKGF